MTSLRTVGVRIRKVPLYSVPLYRETSIIGKRLYLGPYSVATTRALV